MAYRNRLAYFPDKHHMTGRARPCSSAHGGFDIDRADGSVTAKTADGTIRVGRLTRGQPGAWMKARRSALSRSRCDK